MVKNQKQLKIKDLNDFSVIEDYLQLEKKDVSELSESSISNIWCEFVLTLFDYIKSKKTDYSKILKVFEPKTLAYIYFSSSNRHSIFDYLIKLDFKFSILEAININSLQWYSETPTVDDKMFVFDKFYHLEEKSFFDERFSIYPIFTNSYRLGRDRSLWLKDKKEGYVSLFDDKTNSKIIIKSESSAYNSIYMDAKLGFIVYFKDLPSMYITFNFDSNKNIFIHQIQSKHKDRGHYKINDWQNYFLNFVKKTFSGFNINIISGESAEKIIWAGYKSIQQNEPDVFELVKPSKERVESVVNFYNSFGDNVFNKFDIIYIKL